MSNANTTLTLALGAGGGLAAWYLLRDKHRKTPAPANPPSPARTNAPAPAVTKAASPPARAITQAPTARACALRLDASGLIADGSRVTVADAVKRCTTAGSADVIVIQGAPAATYAELMIALGRAGIPTHAHRNRGADFAGLRFGGHRG
jgi:hypothetical protein